MFPRVVVDIDQVGVDGQSRSGRCVAHEPRQSKGRNAAIAYFDDQDTGAEPA